MKVCKKCNKSLWLSHRLETNLGKKKYFCLSDGKDNTFKKIKVMIGKAFIKMADWSMSYSMLLQDHFINVKDKQEQRRIKKIKNGKP